MSIHGNLEMIRIRQKFDASSLTDIRNAVRSELRKLDLHIGPSSRIAITAGSRGIRDIVCILREAVAFLRGLGAEPFIVPAMGSHGGATAEGQIKVLDELGITEAAVGAPVISSMDVVRTGSIPCNGGMLDVFMDRNAFEADGILVVNRVKPHTSFHGDVESGMMKMTAIGLGKAAQASNIHSFGAEGLRRHIVPVARKNIETGKIIAGLGIVENSYDRTMAIKAFLPHEIESGDAALLRIARSSMPCLPVDDVDVLVVERMGKNISGTGMDTNIIGRLRIQGEPEPERPRIKRIVVLDLTDETGGNALGIGLADFTTEKLVSRMDRQATYANVMASTFIERGKLPIICKDEVDAFDMALKSCGIRNIEGVAAARVVRIKNTLDLEELEISKSIYEDIKDSVEKIL